MSTIAFAFLAIINAKVISRKLLGLTNLSKVGTFNIHKLPQVIIIIKNKNFTFIVFQVVALTFKSLNNNRKTLILSFVLYFGKYYLYEEKAF